MTRDGKRIRTEHLELRAVASRLAHPRVGFIVPKHRHGSVERNQLKRRLREVVRTRLLRALPSVDLVVRARAGAYAASFQVLSAELDQAAARLAGSIPGMPPDAPAPTEG